MDKELKFLIDSGMIDLNDVRSKMEMKKREELLARHTNEVWQGKDGDWYTYMPSEKGRKLKHRKTRKALEDMIVDYYKKVIEEPTIKEIFDEWNNSQLNNGFIKPNTYDRNVKCFNRHLDGWKNKRITSITDEMWIDFLESQIVKYDMTYKAFCGIKHIVEGILLKARRKHCINFCADDVTKNLIIPKNAYRKVEKKDSDEVYTDEEMKKILGYTSQHRDLQNDCITLIFITGMRVGEAVALKHDDLDPKKLVISVSKTESRWRDENGHVHLFVESTTKTEAGTRPVRLPKQFQYLITQLWWNSNSTEYVFMNNGKRMITNTVRNRLRKICKELGIKYRSPHKIRKTYATKAYNSGVDESIIIAQMGHTDIKTTKQFYYWNNATEEEVVDELSRAMTL